MLPPPAILGTTLVRKALQLQNIATPGQIPTNPSLEFVGAGINNVVSTVSRRFVSTNGPSFHEALAVADHRQ
jgi:hypothetical protein